MNVWLLLLLGLALPAVIVGARFLDARAWQESLVSYQIYPPASLTVEEATAWLSGINALTHPVRFTLLPIAPVCFEIVSNSKGISFFVSVTKPTEGQMLSAIRATMPGARLVTAPSHLATCPRFLVAAEAMTTRSDRQLAAARAQQASTTILASLQPVEPGAEIRIQWMLTSAGTPEPVKTVVGKETNVLSWVWEKTASEDAEAVQAARAKFRSPLLLGVVRIGVVSRRREHAFRLLARVWNNLHGLNATGVRVRRRMLPTSVVTSRMRNRTLPLMRWPMVLTAPEAAGLLALPYGVRLPGLSLGRARQLPPPTHMPMRGGAVIGVSDYPGMEDRELRISTTDRLRHMHLISPTGGGKSTLIANMALQDIAAGRGIAVIDPKGDLVTAIAARIPRNRWDDVVVVDPSAVDGSIIGFNPLNTAGSSDLARELVADQVLGVFHSLYREFWGPRTDDVLRAALISVSYTRAPDGSAFTLMEVSEVLTSPTLRRYLSNQASLPQHLRVYWQQFDAMTEEARRQAVGPILNKLRAFSMRSSVRLLLGQSKGVRLDHRFFRRGILLVNLSKGALGTETANLVGSLFVAALWQAALSRSRLPANRRPAFIGYLDEFQDVTRLGTASDLADMLAQSRGLGLGLVLSHQYMNQLPDAVQQAVLGTVRSSVTWQSEQADAVALAKRFSPLTADELQGLGTYEIAARLSTAGSTSMPTTGRTLPLPPATGSAAELAAYSRARHGLAQAAVLAGLDSRVQVTPGSPAIGRKPRGGQA